MPKLVFLKRTRSFWFGLTLPLKSMSLIIKTPSLLVLSLIPIAITLVLYFVLIQSATTHLKSTLFLFLSQEWGLSNYPILFSLVQFIVKIGLFLLSAITFSFVSTLIASPINDFLAERTERFAFPPLPPIKPTAWNQHMRLVFIDIAKSITAAFGGLIAILLSWIPGINVVAIGLAFLLFAFHYISYPQTRRKLGLRAGLGFLWRHLFACLGFGASLAFLLGIPLVSCLALPLAVVGGTLLVARAPGNEDLFTLK